MNTTRVYSLCLTLLAYCAAATQASAQFRPAQMRSSEIAQWSQADCMARANQAFDLEGYFVDSTGGGFYGAHKGSAHAYITCDPSASGKVVWSVIVASTASDESCQAERDRLVSRLKNPTMDGVGGGAGIGGIPGVRTGGTAGRSTGGTSSGIENLPASKNLALNKPAQQSSYYNPANPKDPQFAVDESYDTVSSTDLENQPWWEVDLGAIYRLTEAHIYNRKDCCRERLRTFKVLLSDDHLSWRQYYSHDGSIFGDDGRPLTLQMGTQARYVRIQLSERNYLSLAEIEVYGTTVLGAGGGEGTGGLPGAQPGSTAGGTLREPLSSPPEGSLVNIALGRPAKQSSYYSQPARLEESQGAVDGKKDGRFGFHTQFEPNPWWQVDLGSVIPLTEIRIFNRLDCCSDRARTIQVLLSNDENNWTRVFANNGSTFGGNDGKPLVVPLSGYSARFVRLQLTETYYLHLDEVEIYQRVWWEEDSTAGRGTSPTQPSTRVPASVNLAINRPAQQSSFYNPSNPKDPQYAIDGNSDTFSSTDLENQPWWEVDLGAIYKLTEARIYNRKDCCRDRLRTFKILLSNDRANWRLYYSHNGSVFGDDERPFTLRMDTQARYVRIQLNERNYLSLTEVEIYGLKAQ